ncbi:MAG: helix-turn-helix domain-containing protein [Candidatus Omnitrophica bacterium]|nr:helix-turn-helix domain-containing protein [Candidatus Omnitrophota bacterium]
MTAVGNVLKEARDKKAVTLEEVHAKIKIHPRILKDLEEGRFEKLPGPVFVKNFIRSYAEFLGLDPAELLAAYEKQMQKGPEPTLFIKPAEPRLWPWRSHFSPVKILRGGLIGLVVLGFLLFTGKMWIRVTSNFAASKKQSSLAAASLPGMVRQAHHEKERPDSRKAADEGKKLLRSPVQGNFPKLPQKTALQLKIKAMDNVWLRVTCDGKVLFQSILMRGASETWTAKDQIEIWTGNASNMSLSLNGRSLGTLGRGVIRKLTIDREGARIDS